MSEEKNESQGQNSNKIIYIGEDQAYWSSLQQEFRRSYKQAIFEFENLSADNPRDIQTLIISVFSREPNSIIIDLSKHTEAMLHLTRILVKANFVFQPFICNLMDITTPREVIRSAVMTNAPVVHVKSSELEAIIHSIVSFAMPDLENDHGFATAELQDEIFAFSPCKVGVISPLGLRLESNLNLNKGSTYPLNTEWLQNKSLFSPNALLANQYFHDLYYNYPFAQEFGFEFVQPVIDDPETPEDIMEERRANYEIKMEESKRKMLKWVKAHMELSAPKALRILVVDKTFKYFDDQPKSDVYPYVIRCQPFLKFVKRELLHEYSQMIVFNYEEVDPEELKAKEEIAYSFNEFNNLAYLIKTINSIEGYEPYIIVFNCSQYDTNGLKSSLNYHKIISYNDILTPEMVDKMAKMLAGKLGVETQEYSVPTVFIPKTHPFSYAEIEIPIKVLAISEQDVYFTSPLQMEKGTILRMIMHVDIHVTIAPTPKTAKNPEAYYGVIHGVNEKDKMELRRWINAVFFRQLEEQKAEERADVERIKQEAIAKKQAEEEEAKRKAEEEEQRKLQEEEEKVRAEIEREAAKEAAAAAESDSEDDSEEKKDSQN